MNFVDVSAGRRSIIWKYVWQDELTEKQIQNLQTELIAKVYTNRLTYVDQETAATLLEEDLGEDFVDFLGYNPLSASIDLYLKAAFADEDQIQEENYKNEESEIDQLFAKINKDE